MEMVRIRIEPYTISILDAARVLGISKSSAYRMAKAGRLPGLIQVGPRRYVVARPVLEQALGLPPGGLLQGNNECKKHPQSV